MPGSINIDLTKAIAQSVWTDQHTTSLDVLRIDLIHPVISGNKWFKLKYYLDEAASQNLEGIITCGGAYSNHLVATAGVCKMKGLRSVGIVRGEKPAVLSPTLADAQQLGMDLIFVSRNEYKNKTGLQQWAAAHHPKLLWIDEGGQGELGVRGAADIASLVHFKNYTHIVCAVGTGTMMAGLLNAADPFQQVIGIPVLKINDPINNTLTQFLKKYTGKKNYQLLYNFYGKGYGKFTPSLLLFMNALYEQYQLPTDFVYTGKLFKAIFHLTAEGFFPEHSKVLAIHSGGLQGNRSIEKDVLTF